MPLNGSSTIKFSWWPSLIAFITMLKTKGGLIIPSLKCFSWWASPQSQRRINTKGNNSMRLNSWSIASQPKSNFIKNSCLNPTHLSQAFILTYKIILTRQLLQEVLQQRVTELTGWLGLSCIVALLTTLTSTTWTIHHNRASPCTYQTLSMKLLTTSPASNACRLIRKAGRILLPQLILPSSVPSITLEWRHSQPTFKR